MTQTQHSITGTESFAARLIRSERLRVGLMALSLLILLLTTVIRRLMGGLVMSENWVFYPTICALSLGVLYQGIVWLALRHWARVGGIPNWHRWLSVVADLTLPFTLLLITQLHSPRGEYAALSAPSLLLIPMVIVLSILRLHPWFTFWTGVGGTIVHLSLTVRAIQVADIDWDHLPLLLSYGILIFLTGICASVVAWMMRVYVIEAVAEATESEQAKRVLEAIERDLRVARDIQVGLLPESDPQIGGYEIAGMAHPATHAGGDYYDWQAMPDGKLIVVIADVTGHGIGPALVMAVCRAYARATAPVTAGLELLMQRLNDLIFQDVKGERFITMAVALLDADGSVELVSAGHGPTLLYHAATGEVESFGGDGIPLGILASEQYGPSQKLRLESGDVLLMLTDGFFEHLRKSDQQQFGTQRLEQTLKASASKSAGDLIKSIDQAVREFAEGTAQADDMTAVAIKRA